MTGIPLSNRVLPKFVMVWTTTVTAAPRTASMRHGLAWFVTESTPTYVNEGTYECVSSSQSCNDNTGNDTDVCDGADNDCNPATADGSGETAPDITGAPNGVCSGEVQTCTGGGWQDDYSGVTDYEATEASCDGLDNDCDGSIDAGLTPSDPSNLQASASSSSRINLSWNDNSDCEDGFMIERSPNGTTEWSQIYTANTDATSYPNTGLTADTIYHYRIRAYNDVSYYSGYSNQTSATTQTSGSGAPDGAVAYWKFNDNTGVNAYDETSNNNNGTLTGGTTWTTGKSGSALSFDGANDYVDAGNDSSLDITAAVSIEAWVNIDSITENYPMIVIKTPVNQAYLLFVWGTAGAASGTAPFTMRVDVGGSKDVSSTTNIVYGQWYHVVGTYDGETVKIYVNGNFENENTAPSGPIDSTTGAVGIGGDIGGGSYSLDGKIDEVVIYDLALTANQVEANYLKNGAEMSNLTVNDNSGGGIGIQSGDQVVIVFNAETDAPTIDASNIDTALVLNNGHSWKDGSSGLGSPAPTWSSTGGNPNDTLTVTLSDTTSVPTVVVGDTVTLAGSIIKNKYDDPVISSNVIGGSFGVCTDGDNDNYYMEWDCGSAVDCNDGLDTINPGATEVCDGVDNDCNGGTADGADEAWLGTNCDGADSDLCEEGTYSCVSSAQSCSDATGNTLDVCDGSDNDCNPATADGSGETAPDNTLQAGVCTGSVQSCTSGTWGNDYSGVSNYEATETSCDSLDNDCDGQPDEGCLPSDAVSYWKFDENSGTTAFDSAGNNDGTLTDPPSWTTGKSNSALSFDGSSDYVTIDHDSSLLITGDLTLEAWIYRRSNSSTAVIINKRYSYELEINASNYLKFNTGNGRPWITSTQVVQMNQWHLITVVYDTSKSNEVTFYIDGEAISSHDENTAPRNFTNDLLLGKHPSLTRYFDGLIDEVVIYNRALNCSEVLDQYHRFGDTGGSCP